MAFRTPAFWLIALGSLLFGFSTMAVTQNQVPHLIDIGFSASVAASAVSIVGAFSGIGKFLFGFLCDLMNPKYARAIGLGLQLTAIIIIMNLSPSSPLVLIWLYAILIGLSFGSWVPSLSMLTSTNFGLVAYGSILGMMAFFDMGGGAFGPLFAGYIYDVQQSYILAFNVFLVLISMAITASLLIRKPKIR
jgi:MFS family permease